MSRDRRTTDASWGEIPAARDRVVELLNESGAPLEAQVARLCQRFVSAYDGHQGANLSAEPLIYGDDDERPLREIDQLVTLYQELDVGDHHGIQLIFYVPIEVKHRRDIQLFGIEVDDVPTSAGAIPIGGQLAMSELIRTQVSSVLPEHMATDPRRRVAAVSFKGSAPHAVFKENLVYNAAAGLYDFIMSSATSFRLRSTVTAMEHEGAMSQFDAYCDETHYAPAGVARKWVGDLPQERFDSFAEIWAVSGRRMFRTVDVYGPVVCVDSPMHVAEIDGLGDITGFEATDCLLTSVRVAGWTSRGASTFVRRTPEAVTTVATVRGLEALLPGLLEYFGRITDSLAAIDEHSYAKAMFEHDFLAAVAERFRSAGGFRSDLDLHWMS